MNLRLASPATAVLAAVVTVLLALLPHGASAYFAPHPDAELCLGASVSYRVLEPIVETGRVSVIWSGITGDQSDDFVSVWLSGANFTYIRYANTTTPSGSADFTLLNAPGQSYVFRYFRGDLLVAAAEPLEPVRHVPLMPRLTTTEDPSMMVMRYTTDRFVAGVTGCRVRESTSDNWIEILASAADVTTYTQEDFLRRSNLPPIPIESRPFSNFSQRRKVNHCHDSWCYNADTAVRLFVAPGLFINVEVSGLRAGRTYEYTCGEVGGGSLNPVVLPLRSFKGRALPSGGAGATRVIWTADAGTGYGVGNGRPQPDNCSYGTPFCLKEDPWGGSVVGGMVYEDTPTPSPSFIIFGGDVTYNRGWGSYNWQLFAHQTANIAGRIPAIAFNGNHDIDWQLNPLQGIGVNGNDSGGEGGIALASWYGLSTNGSWGIRKAGPLAWIALDSELPPAPQLEWLENVVTPNLNRSETPWVVVSLHRPLVKNNMKPLNDLHVSYFSDWIDAHADVVLFGHDHFYGRYYPLAFSAVPNPAVCPSAHGTGTDSDIETRTSPYSQECRVSFTEYNEQQLNPQWTAANAQCFLGAWFNVSSRNDCRSACAKDVKCQGTELEIGSVTVTTSACQLLSCDVATIATQGGLEYSANRISSVGAMRRQRKAAPTYILDGAAGMTGEHPDAGPHGSPVDSRYEAVIFCPPERNDPNFYNCTKYGWTEVTANATHLSAAHYHFVAPDAPVDEVTLTQHQ